MVYRNSSRLGAVCSALLLLLLAGCVPGAPGPAAGSLTPTSTEPADATLAAALVIAQKASAAAAMAMTLTAEPTDTPTPTPQVDTGLCSSADLAPEARSNGATGSITFTIVLTNVGDRACNLQGPPQIQLVNAQRFPLEVQALPVCFLCESEDINLKTPSPATQVVLSPTQTAAAHDTLTGTLSLIPGQAVKIFLIWYNYCQPFPSGGVAVRLTLPPDGWIDIPTDARTGGRCDASDHPSTLMVSQYSYR